MWNQNLNRTVDLRFIFAISGLTARGKRVGGENEEVAVYFGTQKLKTDRVGAVHGRGKWRK